MDKLLDIIAKWEPFGQGIFFLMVIAGLLTSVNFAFKMLAVIVRGWPPFYEEVEDEESE